MANHAADRAQGDFQDPAGAAVELYDALLRLNCPPRVMFDVVEDLNTARWLRGWPNG